MHRKTVFERNSLVGKRSDKSGSLFWEYEVGFGTNMSYAIYLLERTKYYA